MPAGADTLTPQLPLGFSLAPGATFDSYFTGPNALAVGLLRDMARGSGEQQIHLAGSAGLGKTHLLQALCRAAGAAGEPVAYLPLAEVGGMDPAVVEGLEQVAVVAIDDVACITGNQAWEHALFNLINTARASGTRLAFAARSAPGDIGLHLPDLASRLAWGPVVRLDPLDDDAKRVALAARARVLGLELPPAVGEYLVRHDRRDLAGLLARLEELDQASLAAGRRLTIPLVRAILKS